MVELELFDEARIRAYLERLHSIPAFLSNLTMQLFQQKTFAC
jgi:hypothetical protein